jgi:hypothetical protein
MTGDRLTENEFYTLAAIERMLPSEIGKRYVSRLAGVLRSTDAKQAFALLQDPDAPASDHARWAARRVIEGVGRRSVPFAT